MVLRNNNSKIKNVYKFVIKKINIYIHIFFLGMCLTIRIKNAISVYEHWTG